MWDVAIVGSGPAGASCASFCAAAGLRTLVIERAKFPREKVCGDCLNPSSWPVLERLGVAEEVRAAPHEKLRAVEFIRLDGHAITVPLPNGADAEIAMKRSLFDNILLRRARSLGAEVREGETLLSVRQNSGWEIATHSFTEQARILVAADGRNSTVAHLCGLKAKNSPERVALQAHIPLPQNFGQRVVLQLLPQGYSGQAPVGDGLLNLCLVSRPNDINALKLWAQKRFAIPAQHSWRTITPLARATLPAVRERARLLLIGDAARVVEPFTGEGIFYALRSGELAARAIAQNQPASYAAAHRALYWGRLWLNQLARAAATHPRLTTQLLRFLPNEKRALQLLTAKVSH